MKKKKVSKRRSTPMLTLNERVATLESETAFIKEQVSNHIPTELKAHRELLESIQRKQGDMDAISRFLSICLKGAATLVSLIWAGKQVWEKLANK